MFLALPGICCVRLFCCSKIRSDAEGRASGILLSASWVSVQFLFTWETEIGLHFCRDAAHGQIPSTASSHQMWLERSYNNINQRPLVYRWFSKAGFLHSARRCLARLSGGRVWHVRFSPRAQLSIMMIYCLLNTHTTIKCLQLFGLTIIPAIMCHAALSGVRHVCLQIHMLDFLFWVQALSSVKLLLRL